MNYKNFFLTLTGCLFSLLLDAAQSHSVSSSSSTGSTATSSRQIISPELLTRARQALPVLRANIDQQVAIAIQNAGVHITPVADKLLKKIAFTSIFVTCTILAAIHLHYDSTCSPKFVIFTLAALIAYKQAFGN